MIFWEKTCGKDSPELLGTIHETHFRKAMNEQEIQYFEAQGIIKLENI